MAAEDLVDGYLPAVTNSPVQRPWWIHDRQREPPHLETWRKSTESISRWLFGNLVKRGNYQVTIGIIGITIVNIYLLIGNHRFIITLVAIEIVGFPIKPGDFQRNQDTQV